MKCPLCDKEMEGVLTAVDATVYIRYRLQGDGTRDTEEEGSDSGHHGYIFCEHCGNDLDIASDENISKWLGSNNTVNSNQKEGE